MRRWLDTLKQDLAYGLRSFRRSPGFVAVALLSLTLGTGATSAIFSVIYGVIIDPYPYADADHIWLPEVRGVDGRDGHTYTVAELRELQASPAFASVMATSCEPVLLTGEFAPESLTGGSCHGERLQLPRRAARGRPHHPALGHPRQRRRGAGRGPEPPPVAAAVRRQSGRGREDAAPERTPAHDRRRDAAPVRLVDERRPLAAAVADPHRRPWVSPIVRLAPGVTAAAAEEQMPRSTAGWPGEAGPTAFRSRASRRRLRNYMDVTVASGEMRTSLQPAARRGRLPAADRLRQRRQPAAGARRLPGPRDRGADVDRRRPPSACCASSSPRACCCRSPAARSACCSRSARSGRSSR